MSKPTIADLEKLIREIIFPFYQIERTVPLRFAPRRYENDAEHSWSLALFACALAPRVDPKLDVGKVAQFAIVHDLVEIHAGDTNNFAPEAERATKDEREREALGKLRQEFKLFPWITETIATYEKQASAEARFVKSVDKLILLLIDYFEEGQFYHEHKITLEMWRAKMQKHREKAARHPGAFAYYDEIWNLLLANPQFFHQEK
ncbi:MAG TPA: HD domain-containing protein [Candidatus Saccharimonadales bacterium]